MPFLFFNWLSSKFSLNILCDFPCRRKEKVEKIDFFLSLLSFLWRLWLQPINTLNVWVFNAVWVYVVCEFVFVSIFDVVTGYIIDRKSDSYTELERNLKWCSLFNGNWTDVAYLFPCRCIPKSKYTLYHHVPSYHSSKWDKFDIIWIEQSK